MKRKCICLIAFAISAASCMKEETPVPFAGRRMDGVALYRNQIASYWTSTPYTAEMSKYLAFDISGYSAPSLDSANRAIAMSVRCVLITD